MTNMETSAGYSKAIIDEINIARSEPIKYILKLEAHRAKFIDDFVFKRPPPENLKIKTTEGIKAVNEAIELFKTLTPRQPLTACIELEKAALDHVNDMATCTTVGHTGRDKSSTSDRIRRYGMWSHKIGENLRMKTDNAEEIVLAWIIDDSKKPRASQINCLSPDFLYAGAAIGLHDKYGVFCTVVFAHYAGPFVAEIPKVIPSPSWKERPGELPAPPAPKLTPYANDDADLEAIAAAYRSRAVWQREPKDNTAPSTRNVGQLVITEKEAPPPIEIHRIGKVWEPPPRPQSAPVETKKPGWTGVQSYLPKDTGSNKAAATPKSYVSQSYLPKTPAQSAANSTPKTFTVQPKANPNSVANNKKLW